MIILPDHRLSRGKFLMPIPKREWREPSHALFKDQFNNPGERTYFRICAKNKFGELVWQGWFEDRDDADAFLFSLVSGAIRYERSMWRLPTPEWHPGLGENLSYHFVTTTFLTTLGSANTYNVPSDWNNSNNLIQCIGGGGSGGSRRSDLTNGCNASGAGGGGYGEYTNLSLTAGGTATYGIVNGGAAVTRTSNGSTSGNSGGASYFNGSSYALAPVGGAGGEPGLAGTGTFASTDMLGGSGKGTASANGGNGGAITSSSTARRGTGGGGAGGPNGNGNNGVALGGSSSSATDGGSGDAGFGGAAGAGGTGTGGTGGDGTEFQVSPAYGCGGGGGGRQGTSATTAGAGGNYGAGGGGSAVSGTSSSTSGTGADGLIVVNYTPPSTNSLANNNLAMIGM